MNEMASKDKLTPKARDWLLMILRFAVTLEPTDRVAVLKIAHELDRPKTDSTSANFTFFTRTSFDFCNAISDKNNPERTTILRRNIARIEDPRLKRALEAAVDSGVDQCESYRAMWTLPKQRWQRDLWKGLPSARRG